MSNSNINKDLMNLVQANMQEMEAGFCQKFEIGNQFTGIAEICNVAADFDKKWNVVLVTVRSDPKESYLVLACKHHGEYKAGKKSSQEKELGFVNEGEDKSENTGKKLVRKDTQRNGCSCFIKFNVSPSGGLKVSDMCGKHNHPIPSCRTTYSVHRKQSAEIMNLIM
ncbi:hypothetical protein RMATCC62417_16712 [Rhizopus microsporus]|nr:hypothetical protein RMATCC62417_16712 [Rhizopus microsporus]